MIYAFQALADFAELYPDHRTADIQHSMDKGRAFLKSIQRSKFNVWDTAGQEASGNMDSASDATVGKFGDCHTHSFLFSLVFRHTVSLSSFCVDIWWVEGWILYSRTMCHYYV